MLLILFRHGGSSSLPILVVSILLVAKVLLGHGLLLMHLWIFLGLCGDGHWVCNIARDSDINIRFLAKRLCFLFGHHSNCLLDRYGSTLQIVFHDLCFYARLSSTLVFQTWNHNRELANTCKPCDFGPSHSAQVYWLQTTYFLPALVASDSNLPKFLVCKRYNCTRDQRVHLHSFPWLFKVKALSLQRTISLFGQGSFDLSGRATHDAIHHALSLQVVLLLSISF